MHDLQIIPWQYCVLPILFVYDSLLHCTDLRAVEGRIDAVVDAVEACMWLVVLRECVMSHVMLPSGPCCADVGKFDEEVPLGQEGNATTLQTPPRLRHD